jgi:hypothetical protein
VLQHVAHTGPQPSIYPGLGRVFICWQQTQRAESIFHFCRVFLPARGRSGARGKITRAGRPEFKKALENIEKIGRPLNLDEIASDAHALRLLANSASPRAFAAFVAFR